MATFLYDARRGKKVCRPSPLQWGPGAEGPSGWASEATRPLLVMFLFMLASSPFSLQPALSESLIWKLNHISELTALHL